MANTTGDTPMASLTRFLVARTATVTENFNRRNALTSGIVVRLDGGQVIVNVGGQSLACQPTLGLPLQAGDSVWVRRGLGQPQIAGYQGRNGEVG